MTQSEKLKMLGVITGEKDTNTLTTYLAIAGDKILGKLYPFSRPSNEVPEPYSYRQVEIAAYLLNKRGAEGETAHSENGTSRSYENGDLPSSLVRDIVPFSKPL